MKPIYNQVPHNPEKGSYGDCHRVVIASLLDLEADQVPHFYSKGPAEPEITPEQWLNQNGYCELQVLYPGEVSLEEVLSTQKHMNPDVYYILGGTSKKDCGHSVICCGGEIVHDPSGSGITGPLECKEKTGFYWWLTFILPLSMKRLNK